MSVLGPYAVFIATSYALVALVVGGLIAAIVVDYRHQQAELRRLEASGVMRRSSGKTSEQP
ncbi:MAG: heme exporter protein CcmD [Afipia felis]|uniref:Heme exporter protein D n=2 Tax=Afipia felis TaxID=1035 RepID=A0A380WCP5_AFIFE|nr:heme exporter protein CcmD [Afipia felis]EKS29976.1 heme exporter protein CcmD [Afipia felis ATCC 53690]MBN9602835.1 heme exporter protein CcmD [Afipia felis]SUU78683.1 heme exporter protein CcmD [Afipia felis]SUU86748.1 heme exporter protein CcmD [Afipia felis]